MIKIKIKFLGILKEYFKDINLEIQQNITLKILKKNIIMSHSNKIPEHLKYTIEKSIFSNKNKILNDEEIIKENCTLYLLPPFSGG